MRATPGLSRRGFAAAVAGFAVLGTARAQSWPSRPIHMIVPESPGSTPDTTARLLAPEMARILGQPVVIENRPGAGQMIGLEYVAKRAPADGYTVVLSSASNLAILPVTVKALRFDPLKELPPVIGLAEGRLLLASPVKMPWKTATELIAHGKANPGKINFGSSNPIVRLSSEAFLRGTGIEATLIPYSGTGPYFQALAAGEDIHMGFLSVASALTLGERIRVLAATGETRREPFLDVPTFNELGLPQIIGLGWTLNVPVGTPPAVIEALHGAASAALKSTDVRAHIRKVHLDITDQPPDVAARKLADNGKLFAEIARNIGFRPE